ncbi:DUF3800 domain-containing protein [Pandoraea sp.]|uniref:DUF3800 domain-containing protein n=1 Tax=Pandoraea sp. TaxID=1883445 RepID=UPI0034504F50
MATRTAGRLRNFAEVPLFVDSRATRLMQLADTMCYWIFISRVHSISGSPNVEFSNLPSLPRASRLFPQQPAG